MKRKTARIIRNTLLVLLSLALIVAAVDLWYMTSADKRFIRAANRGLIEGWETSEPESALRDLNLKKWDTSFIDAEYNAVASFKDSKFRDEKLGKLAARYIKALEACRNAAKEKDPNKNYNAFWKKFSKPYGRRLRAICSLYKGGYILEEMPEEYNDRLDDILLQGWALNKTEKISFKRGDTENELVAKVKNNSGHPLDYIELTIDLYDDQGQFIETVTAYESDIKKDASFRIRCYETNAGTASEFVIKAINCEKAD